MTNIETIRDKENGVLFSTKYHWTTRERKCIKLAYSFCKSNAVNSCKVNTFKFVFNFENGTGYYTSRQENADARNHMGMFLPDAAGEVKFGFSFASL